MRTFAAQRIQEVAVLEDTFDPREASTAVFPDSLSVYSGSPEHVVIDFSPAEAPYIRERDWHPSQQLTDRPAGGVRLALDVVIDWGLEAWILGFGDSARAVAPPSLVERLTERLEAARAQYATPHRGAMIAGPMNVDDASRSSADERRTGSATAYGASTRARVSAVAA